MLKIISWLKISLLGCTGALLLSVQAYPQAIDEVVLVVDKQAITAREFSVLHLIHDQSKSYTLVMPKIGEPITDAIVDEVLLAEHAKRLAQEASVSNEQIDAAIKNLASQNKITSQQLLSGLKSQGVDVLIFRDSLRQRILVQQVLGQRIARSVNVSDSEVKEYIGNRPDLKNQTQKRYRASHLVIPFAEDLSKNEIKALHDVTDAARVRLLAGESFSAVLSSIEAVQSSSENGDLGWKQRNELPELFVSALDKLQAGEISPVLESGNGFHLLALMEVETSAGVPKEYKTRHILKALAPKADAANVLKEIQNLKAQILAGVDFASVAKAESQDPGTAPDGGALGWIKVEQIDPLFAQAMAGLKVGQISDPIRTKFGLHLIQVLEVRNLAGVATLETRVRQRIFAEKVDEKMQDLLNDIKQIALIEVVSQ